MGIDIYATWAGMTKEDQEAQYTGFKNAGASGYLREAYHGGPYATHELLPETRNEDAYIESDTFYEGVPIETKKLRQRLPRAIIAAMIREATIYESKAARDALREIGIEAAAPGHNAVVRSATDPSPTELLDCIKSMLNETQKSTEQHIPDTPVIPTSWEQFDMPRALLAFVEFVEKKEMETGQPIRIINSY